MDDVVRVHDLATVIGDPDDAGHQNLRAIISASTGDVFVADAQTNRKYLASLDTDGEIKLVPIDQT